MNENKIDIMLKAQIKYTEKLWEEKEELQQRIDKAIDYINKHMRIDDEYPDYMEMLIEERNELLEILRDKGIEEIPLFDGTLEQLNNLSIIGDKENE